MDYGTFPYFAYTSTWGGGGGGGGGSILYFVKVFELKTVKTEPCFGVKMNHLRYF